MNFGWEDFGFDSFLEITDAEIVTDAVPEPSAFLLLSVGLLGLAKIRRYGRRTQQPGQPV